MARRLRKLPEPSVVHIEAMSHEGRGITRIDGKTIFVSGALKGEEVKIQVKKISRNFDEAITLEVLQASALRVEPKCRFFEVCGGCSLQHMNNNDQVIFKQQSLLEMFQHAGINIGTVISPLRSSPWGYRRKARLGVKYVRKKGRVLVGFREKNTPFLADMSSCEILVPEVGYSLVALAGLIESLEARETIPQIEVACDDDHVCLAFRHLKPLSDGDTQKLVDFAKANELWIQLQSGGPETITNLYPDKQALYFRPLKDGEIKIGFKVVDFTQVNVEINQQMVAQALHFLDLKPEDKVLDLFCGLGNFTLPIAGLCSAVTGVEGDLAMVTRAMQNALEHKIDNSEYYAADLTQPDPDAPWMKQQFDKILLDPPRSGALEVARLVSRFNARIIVYVSCQPASLVRDSKIICDSGYRLAYFGVMDMFPQTAHVEAMAIFQQDRRHSN